MRSLFFAFAWFVCGMPGHGQALQGQARIDSLMARGRQAATDTAKCRSLLEAARHYQELDPERGIRVGLEGLEIAQRIGDPEWIGNAYAVIARNYQVSGRQDEALDYIIKAEQAYGQLEDKKPGLKLKLLKAKVYATAGRLQEAIDISRRVHDDARDERNEMSCLAAQNHAAFLAQAGRDEEALEFLDEAIAHGEKYGSPNCLLTALVVAANIHAHAGRLYEGLEMMERALEQSVQAGNKLLQSMTLNNMAYSLVDAAALPADQLDPRLGSPHAMLDRAEQCATQAVDIARQGNYQEVIQNGLFTLAKVQEARKEYREALETFQRFFAIYDSVMSADHSATIARLEGQQQEMLLKRDLDEKDGQLASAKELRIRLSTALVMAFLGAGVLLLMNRRVRSARRRSDDLLLNILPAATAQELKETGTTTPRQYDHTTVLFTDFVGFARVLEGHPPQEVVELIDAYFRPFDRIVQRHGLEKIKTIGDAYMAVCGVPDPRPDHAVAAVRAALEMLAFVMAEGERRAAAGLPHFQIRIGLHSGPLVAGVVGESKFAYDIWGETVNTAARFEQHGEVDRVNISRSTFEQVKHHFRCTPRGTVMVKHGVELELFQVEGGWAKGAVG